MDDVDVALRVNPAAQRHGACESSVRISTVRSVTVGPPRLCSSTSRIICEPSFRSASPHSHGSFLSAPKGSRGTARTTQRVSIISLPTGIPPFFVVERKVYHSTTRPLDASWKQIRRNMPAGVWISSGVPSSRYLTGAALPRREEHVSIRQGGDTSLVAHVLSLLREPRRLEPPSTASSMGSWASYAPAVADSGSLVEPDRPVYAPEATPGVPVM
mmetsp:Transcript_27660/g.84324  ORF Transcript_27660/g.84324 Transcript_27660/m.84324 type:complete len:215 (+) Transcript_27660:1405-2049(+)